MRGHTIPFPLCHTSPFCTHEAPPALERLRDGNNGMECDLWLASGFPGRRRMVIIRLIRPMLPVPILQARAGHALAQAALFKEIFLQTAKLLVNQVVHLVNSAVALGEKFVRKAEGEVIDHLCLLKRQ